MSYSMAIALHAGKCCGMKTIHTLPKSPDRIVYEKLETTRKYLSADRYGNEFSTDFNFYWGEAPQETAIKRFDRYIEYLERVRHYGLVEVVLAVHTDHTCDQLHGHTVDELESGDISSFDEAVSYALESEDEWGDYDFEEGGHSNGSQQEEWIPELEQRGFKEVSRFPNVNSGNEVAVFHLVMNADYYKQKKGGKQNG